MGDQHDPFALFYDGQQNTARGNYAGQYVQQPNPQQYQQGQPQYQYAGAPAPAGYMPAPLPYPQSGNAQDGLGGQQGYYPTPDHQYQPGPSAQPGLQTYHPVGAQHAYPQGAYMEPQNPGYAQTLPGYHPQPTQGYNPGGNPGNYGTAPTYVAPQTYAAPQAYPLPVQAQIAQQAVYPAALPDLAGEPSAVGLPNVSHDVLEGILKSCLQHQSKHPDPRKFRSSKLFTACRNELVEKELMNARDFYLSDHDLCKGIQRAAHRGYPISSYYLGLCYMQGQGGIQGPNLYLAQQWLEKAHQGTSQEAKRLALRALLYRREIILQKIYVGFVHQIKAPGGADLKVVLRGIFEQYKGQVASCEDANGWRSHLEEQKNMSCQFSTLILGVCHAVGFGGPVNKKVALKEIKLVMDSHRDVPAADVILQMVENRNATSVGGSGSSTPPPSASATGNSTPQTLEEADSVTSEGHMHDSARTSPPGQLPNPQEAATPPPAAAKPRVHLRFDAPAFTFKPPDQRPERVPQAASSEDRGEAERKGEAKGVAEEASGAAEAAPSKEKAEVATSASPPTSVELPNSLPPSPPTLPGGREPQPQGSQTTGVAAGAGNAVHAGDAPVNAAHAVNAGDGGNAADAVKAGDAGKAGDVVHAGDGGDAGQGGGQGAGHLPARGEQPVPSNPPAPQALHGQAPELAAGAAADGETEQEHGQGRGKSAEDTGDEAGATLKELMAVIVSAFQGRNRDTMSTAISTGHAIAINMPKDNPLRIDFEQLMSVVSKYPAAPPASPQTSAPVSPPGGPVEASPPQPAADLARGADVTPPTADTANVATRALPGVPPLPPPPPPPARPPPAVQVLRPPPRATVPPAPPRPPSAIAPAQGAGFPQRPAPGPSLLPAARPPGPPGPDAPRALAAMASVPPPGRQPIPRPPPPAGLPSQQRYGALAGPLRQTSSFPAPRGPPGFPSPLPPPPLAPPGVPAGIARVASGSSLGDEHQETASAPDDLSRTASGASSAAGDKPGEALLFQRPSSSAMDFLFPQERPATPGDSGSDGSGPSPRTDSQVPASPPVPTVREDFPALGAPAAGLQRPGPSVAGGRPLPPPPVPAPTRPSGPPGFTRPSPRPSGVTARAAVPPPLPPPQPPLPQAAPARLPAPLHQPPGYEEPAPTTRRVEQPITKADTQPVAGERPTPRGPPPGVPGPDDPGRPGERGADFQAPIHNPSAWPPPAAAAIRPTPAQGATRPGPSRPFAPIPGSIPAPVPAAAPQKKDWANVARGPAPAPPPQPPPAQDAKPKKIALPPGPRRDGATAGKAPAAVQPPTAPKAAQTGGDAEWEEPEKYLVQRIRKKDENDWQRRFDCPLTLETYKCPLLTADGHTYEQATIVQWLEEKKTSPNTGKPLDTSYTVENKYLRFLIDYILTGEMGLLRDS